MRTLLFNLEGKVYKGSKGIKKKKLCYHKLAFVGLSRGDSSGTLDTLSSPSRCQTSRICGQTKAVLTLKANHLCLCLSESLGLQGPPGLQPLHLEATEE